MRKLIITHERFHGEIAVVYGEEQELLLVDFTNAQLNTEQRQYFTSRMPPILDNDFINAFQNANGVSTITVVPEDMEITFDMFWDKYAHKINVARCQKEWKKLGKTDRVKCYYGIAPYFKFLKSLEYNRNKVDPENYLKRRYWENEWKK
ncbi:hypothetical protein D3C80_1279840 [compost metagenome]